MRYGYQSVDFFKQGSNYIPVNLASLGEHSLFKPSIPLWVGKMSTWQMMAIGGICAFQIGTLHRLENQDMAAKCPVCSPGG